MENPDQYSQSIMFDAQTYFGENNINDGNNFNYSVYPEQDLWVRFPENKARIGYPTNTTSKDKEIRRFLIRLH